MPAKDKFPDAVKHALEKDGWTVTNENLRLIFDGSSTYIDTAAEKPLAPQRNGEKIALEVNEPDHLPILAAPKDVPDLSKSRWPPN